MIDSILFAIKTTRHSSMGMSLYRVIFNKDPLLPFEFVDKQKMHAHVNDSDSDESVTSEIGVDNEVESSSGMDKLMATVQKLEKQRNNFSKKLIQILKKLRPNRQGLTITEIVLVSHFRLVTMC